MGTAASSPAASGAVSVAPTPRPPRSPFDVTLPTQVETQWGRPVATTTLRWRVPRHAEGEVMITLNVAALKAPRERHAERNPNAPRRGSMFAPELLRTITLLLAEQLTHQSPMTVKRTLQGFRAVERWIYDHDFVTQGYSSFTAERIKPVLLESYRHAADAGETNQHGSGALANLFRFGLRERIIGFDGAHRARMRELGNESKRARAAARHRDPRRGAFSWEEQLQIEDALRAERGAVEARALVKLFARLGLRPDAVVLLRRKHVVQDPGTALWHLHVPRVKQVGGAAPDDVKVWRIDADLAALMLAAHDAAPVDAPGHPRDADAGPGARTTQGPLASRAGDGDAGRNVPEDAHATHEPRWDAPLFGFLGTADPHAKLLDYLKRWADEVDLTTTRVSFEHEGWRDKNRKANYAHRQGGPGRWARMLATAKKGEPRLHVFPYRFRRTVATTLAELGASEHEIAEILDDRSLAMAVTYTENTAAIVDVLSQTLDRYQEWLRVLTLFRGRISGGLRQELLVVFGGASQLANYADYVDIGPIGNCTNEAECTWEPPLSCYTCPFIEVVDDPHPHRQQLEQVYTDVTGMLGVESDRMAGIPRRASGAMVQLLDALLLRSSSEGVGPVIRALRSRSRRPAAGTLIIAEPDGGGDAAQASLDGRETPVATESTPMVAPVDSTAVPTRGSRVAPRTRRRGGGTHDA